MMGAEAPIMQVIAVANGNAIGFGVNQPLSGTGGGYTIRAGISHDYCVKTYIDPNNICNGYWPFTIP
jgi:hypothetical protein